VEITPAVAIRQVMPPWQPTDAAGRQSSFKGILKLSITAGGRVERAEFVRSVHPAYDRLVLHASRSWEYRPATRAGIPVASEQLIEIQLKPPQ
jgi:TonB family protein